MSFLPTDYEAPKTSNNYLKLQEGENRIRILSRPIIGWEDWTEDKKPVRFRMNEKPSKSIDPKKPIRHFWAFIVYNILENKIQIMNVTQSTIRKAIEALSKDSDWGLPYHYDIKIMKSGEGKDTEYSINPVPHKTIDKQILELFDETLCNLEALFTSDDPFSREQCEKNVTQLGVENIEIIPNKPKIDIINQEQLDNYLDHVEKLKDEDQIDITLKLTKLGINEVRNMPVATYEILMPTIIGRICQTV